MACTDCNDSSPFQIYNQPFTYNAICTPDGCPITLNSQCTYYGGPNLSCSGISTNDSLELALQKIDTQICSISGNYSSYNTYCLAPITTEKQFVEAISNYACTTRTLLTAFTSTTFPAYQATINTRFLAIEVPGITCSVASVASTDTLQTVLNKYCTALGTLTTAISLAGVTWNNCFTVISNPTTIAQAFSLLADQICQIKANSASPLPVFNNIGTCLPSPGSADTLVDTINKIKTRLCQSPVFDPTTITWGCTTAQASLQATVQTLVTSSNDYKQNKLTYSADFVITQTNSGDPCQGKTIALATPIAGNDRLVATSVSDTTPGTLLTKLAAGAGIAVAEIGSNPSKQIQISSLGLISTTNTQAITLSGNGVTTPHLATLQLSGGAGNAASILSDGLFVTPSLGTGINGITVSGANVGLGGTLINDTTIGANFKLSLQDGQMGIGVPVASIGNNKLSVNSTRTDIPSGVASAAIVSNFSINGSTSVNNDFYTAVDTLTLSLSDTSVIGGANSFNAAAAMSVLDLSGNSSAQSSRRLTVNRAATIFRGVTTLSSLAYYNCKAPENHGSTTTTNMYGLYIEPLSLTGITNTFGIYQEGTNEQNFFGGSINIPNLAVFSDNTAAASLPTGRLYRTASGTLMVKF